MSAPQNSPQLPVPPPRNKKNDAVIAVLVAIIIGGIAGILQQAMEEVSYYEAIKTAGGAILGLLIAIFVILTYVWS